jgi:putative membrane protein insertion efficiency factor
MKIIRAVFIYLIKAYQYFISPLLGSNCRFYPSCSAYAKESFEKLPIHIAIFKTVWRLLRCHPFSRGGVDMVCKSDHSD